MTSLGRLTPSQARMLATLDDGPEEDSVGLEIGQLERSQFEDVDTLIAKGLARLNAGWRMTGWLRLTPEGRRVRISGQGFK